MRNAGVEVKLRDCWEIERDGKCILVMHTENIHVHYILHVQSCKSILLSQIILIHYTFEFVSVYKFFKNMWACNGAFCLRASLAHKRVSPLSSINSKKKQKK